MSLLISLVLFRFFHLFIPNTPWYFLDFALNRAARNAKQAWELQLPTVVFDPTTFRLLLRLAIYCAMNPISVSTV